MVRRAQLTFLITAGPTVEDIDPVRFISNRATGKLGIEAAREALRRGHHVTLVHGPVAEELLGRLPGGGRARERLTVFPVRSTREMYAACHACLAPVDVVLMTAAVADFTPLRFSAEKLKKAAQGRIIRLKPTPDVLKSLGEYKSRRNPRLVLIGFALETGTGEGGAREESQIAEALRKLQSKNLDAIVQDTPEAMGADSAVFRVLTRGDREGYVVRAEKQELASILVQMGEELAGGLPPRGVEPRLLEP